MASRNHPPTSPPIPREVLVVGLSVLLQACASAPRFETAAIGGELPMTTLRDEPHAVVTRFIDVDALLDTGQIGLPKVAIAESALGDGVRAEQAALVANRLARDVCFGLAPYIELSETAPELGMDLVITAIEPTATSAAGASAVLDLVIPGPFRLPAGLGGFAAEGAARRKDTIVLLLRWSEGAGALTEDASLSTIGDAYQLAGDFADAWVDHLIDPLGERGPTRTRLATPERARNERRCRERYGEASLAGRGVSLLLPLAPEAFDAGAPEVPARRPAERQ